jgi:hypothetical protein
MSAHTSLVSCRAEAHNLKTVSMTLEHLPSLSDIQIEEDTTEPFPLRLSWDHRWIRSDATKSSQHRAGRYQMFEGI